VNPDGTLNVAGGLHQNGTVDVSATAACGSCHAVPPTSGRHTKHVVSERRTCGDCHAGYTSSSVNAATHMDGSTEVGNRVTSYNPTTHSCSNSCHGSKTW
jgi:hypothetical protein